MTARKNFIVYVTTIFLAISLTVACPDLVTVPVQVGQRVNLRLTQLENVTMVGWFYCPTKNCDPYWNQHYLAEIKIKTKKRDTPDPDFDVQPDGTLVIKSVLLSYKGVNFIARLHLKSSSKTCTYRLKINKGPPKLTLVSPQDIYAYPGMDLYIEAKVESYPYSLVWLKHYQQLLQNSSNFNSTEILWKVIANITEANSGVYTICAGNAYGIRSLITRVNVQGKIPTSNDTSPSVCPPSGESSEQVAFGIAIRNPYVLLLVAGCVSLILVLILIICFKHCRNAICGNCNKTGSEGEEHNAGMHTNDGKQPKWSFNLLPSLDQEKRADPL